jgi:hypothetical protein
MTRALIAGVLIGVLYTLSPLTIIGVAAMAALLWRVSKDLNQRERAWFLGIFGAAIAIRLAAVAALFLLADRAKPFAVFLGDEELFKFQTLWLRNVGYQLPISPADLIYLYDDVGRSSFIYALAFIQALVGDAPYGNNVLNITQYIAAVAVLFAFFRRAFGHTAALAGATVLLYTPSLFVWSISVLKEPPYILVGAIELVLAARIVEARTMTGRVAAAAGVIACAVALQSLRVGGMALALGGTLLGLSAGVMATRPRLFFASMAVVPLALVLAFTQPRMQERALRAVQDAAFIHWGHVATPGYVYRLLDWRFYENYERTSVYTMRPDEAGRFLIRAFTEFVTVPRPSQIESRSALAYVPEQAVWYAILFFLPFGVAAGLARAPFITCLLLAHGLVAAAMVAVTGGNIGTMIRHRGLTFPYFTWLAAYGACHFISWSAQRHPSAAALPSRSTP